MADAGKRFNSLGDMPHADPRPSVKAGLELLGEVGAEYALIGRVAVWMLTAPEHWRQTLDADFAVRFEDVYDIAGAAGRAGYEVEELPIGGIRVRAGRAVVDFLHMKPGFERLFSEAVRRAEEDRETGIRVAPRDLLTAMKLVPHEEKDEGDVKSLIMGTSKEEYGEIRRVVVDHLGPASGNYLDRIARMIGHPGPGMLRKN